MHSVNASYLKKHDFGEFGKVLTCKKWNKIQDPEFDLNVKQLKVTCTEINEEEIYSE